MLNMEKPGMVKFRLLKAKRTFLHVMSAKAAKLGQLNSIYTIML
jgi:hypothetical protein